LCQGCLLAEGTSRSFQPPAIGPTSGGLSFRFPLSAAGNDLNLTGPLADRVADNNCLYDFAELIDNNWGTGFGTISDIPTGPDGRLYVLSESHGTLYETGPGE
jgi:hypothetical protein